MLSLYTYYSFFIYLNIMPQLFEVVCLHIIVLFSLQEINCLVRVSRSTFLRSKEVFFHFFPSTHSFGALRMDIAATYSILIVFLPCLTKFQETLNSFQLVFGSLIKLIKLSTEQNYLLCWKTMVLRIAHNCCCCL